MDWGSITIGIGGLLLAALTTYLSHQQHKDERVAKYRESLYSKQIEACQSIAQLAAVYLNLIRKILKNEMGKKDLREQVAKMTELEHQLSDKYSEHVIFVTSRMHKAFNTFIVVSRGTTRCIEVMSSKEGEIEIQTFEKELRNSYNELVQSMREIIGTEHFSEETLSIIKK
jgi:hypothetical protein